MCVFVCALTAQKYTNRNACLTSERRCIAENTWRRSLKPGVTLAGTAQAKRRLRSVEQQVQGAQVLFMYYLHISIVKTLTPTWRPLWH